MNGPVITQVPTMCNPDKLSKAELVDHIRFLQDATLSQADLIHRLSCKLSEMNSLSHTLSSVIYALVDAHEENDQAAITVQLQGLSDRRKEFDGQKEKVH